MLLETFPNCFDLRSKYCYLLPEFIFQRLFQQSRRSNPHILSLCKRVDLLTSHFLQLSLNTMNFSSDIFDSSGDEISISNASLLCQTSSTLYRRRHENRSSWNCWVPESKRGSRRAPSPSDLYINERHFHGRGSIDDSRIGTISFKSPRREGQMALKSVYNSSSDSATDEHR